MTALEQAIDLAKFQLKPPVWMVARLSRLTHICYNRDTQLVKLTVEGDK